MNGSQWCTAWQSVGRHIFLLLVIKKITSSHLRSLHNSRHKKLKPATKQKVHVARPCRQLALPSDHALAVAAKSKSLQHPVFPGGHPSKY